MASGFYEIEGGTQPALPQAGKIRIWKDSSDNKTKILYPDGSNFIVTDVHSETEKIIVSPNDELLIYDIATSNFKKIKASNIVPIAIQNRYLTYDEDEFVGTTTAGKLNWAVSVTGTSSSGQQGTYGVNGIERALGVMQIDTGTTATGRACLYRAASAIQMGYCEFDQIWRMAIEALSSATDRFSIHLGFISNVTATGEQVHGAYFRYTDNVNSGNWQCVVRANSVEQVVNTTVPADTAYNIFRIYVNEAGTSALFYINDVLVGTISTGLPITQGYFVGVGVKLEKSVGTTQRNVSIDYHTMKSSWTTER